MSAVIAFFFGTALAVLANIKIPAELTVYVSAATVAQVFALAYSLNNYLQNKFKAVELICFFAINTTFALIMTFIGKKTGIDIFFAIVIIYAGGILSELLKILKTLIIKLDYSSKNNQN